MSTLSEHIRTAVELRTELEDLVVRDLLGPAGGPEEELEEDRVRDRYILGCLAPRRCTIDPAQFDGLGAEDGVGSEDGDADTETPQAPSIFPQSIGLTCCVAPGVPELSVTARWGRYERAESRTLTSAAGAPQKVWRRVPMVGTLRLPLVDGQATLDAPVAEAPDVRIHGLVRCHADGCIVTLFLVNRQAEPEKGQGKDGGWVFQPELILEGVDGQAVFRRRESNGLTRENLDPAVAAELDTLAMLYRQRLEFAVGHGVGVAVEVDPVDHSRARQVATAVAPRHEVALVDSAGVEDWPELAGLVLDMKELADTPREQLAGRLQPLSGAYRAWIGRQRARVDQGMDGLASHGDAALAALERCERVCQRIDEGIQTLQKSREAAEAFRFANRAMWLQRIHGIAAELTRRGEAVTPESVDQPKARTWRLFQLAFILQTLPGLGVRHPDRTGAGDAVADLLWFPTGGGKTEAYLGVAAYAMGLRRLERDRWGRDGEKGVTVLMRYTLRLLTLQQFQRGATLICACEHLRQEAERQGKPIWGTEPFRIGLWVGMRTTPNRTEDADEALKQIRGAGDSYKGGIASPAQLTFCPWCGWRLDPGQDYKVLPFKTDVGRTLVHCPNRACAFSARNSPHEGIPVVMVDHELYRHLPTLVIATVDKLAQLPWNGATQTLFGQVAGYCTRHGFRSPTVADEDSHRSKGGLPAASTVPAGPLRPPDLIIQDELHLISGPLGTLVGLYETAVDELCTWEVEGRRVRPKVIASTATIRRAPEQVHQLFLRQVGVFPPSGLDVGDNFFALERRAADQPDRWYGRRYLGICAPGRRVKSAMIRVYVALLAAAQRQYDALGKAADPWMTLVGYFNSMRELAGMRRVTEDDVRSRLRRTDRRGLARRNLFAVDELTSRKQSDDIPRMLDRLEVQFDPVAEEARKAARKEHKGHRLPRPYDVLLATNMVSVGVDVKRLGLMVVGGQPKTTAEYIQASSRVGRAAPGLVVTVYNWARPRDLSHYERFAHYHATFYQHVEALSVTPFSEGAVERGLSALLVSLVRNRGIDLNDNLAAGQLSGDHRFLAEAIDRIAERAALVTGDQAVGTRTREMLNRRRDDWLHEAGRDVGSDLGYQRGKGGQQVRGLLKKPDEGAWQTFTAPMSLRNVEPTTWLLLKDGGLDDVEERRSKP